MPTPPALTRSTRPLFLLLLNILCVATAELFLSMGSKAAPDSSALDIAALHSPQTLIGILFHISAFVCWMLALRTVPLGLAYNFTAVNQVLVPLAAALLLHEHISPLKWIGILLVLAGCVLLVPLIVRTETQLEPVAALEPSAPEPPEPSTPDPAPSEAGATR